MILRGDWIGWLELAPLLGDAWVNLFRDDRVWTPNSQTYFKGFA